MQENEPQHPVDPVYPVRIKLSSSVTSEPPWLISFFTSFDTQSDLSRLLPQIL